MWDSFGKSRELKILFLWNLFWRKFKKFSDYCFAAINIFGTHSYSMGKWVNDKTHFNDLKVNDIFKLSLDCNKKTVVIENKRTKDKI